MRFSKNSPFWLITLAVLIGLPGVTLIQDGMFMDAMLYTSVAHNEANGFGNFWFPQFSKLNLNIEGISSFHEQPPLVFGIQSVLFRIFGDSMYVERFYVFACTCTMAFLIHLLWRRIFRSRDELRRMSWLPVLIWITVPTVFWGAANNVHENTMGIFTLAAVLTTFTGLQKEKNFPMLHWIAGGLLIFLATLSKGFPGFFPLCVPILYWLSMRSITFKKAFWATVVLVAVPVIIYLILFQVSPSRESLSIYLFKRAFQRIGEAPTTTNRFSSLENLFMDLLPAIGLLVISVFITRIKKLGYQIAPGKGLVIFFILVGLAGSAPLMLTMVQKAFYLLPCYPLFGIAFGLLMAPMVLHMQAGMKADGRGLRIFGGISILLLIASLGAVVMMKGKDSRDVAVLHDTRIVSRIVPAHSTITVTRNMFYIDWELQCYLMRYYYISNDFKPVTPNKYLLIDKSDKTEMDLSVYEKLLLPLQRYDLYRLRQ